MKKVAIYARISTTDQNVDSQLDAVKKYCKNQDWEISKIYKDEGISGTQDSRPALDELKRDCAKRKFEAIVVYKFDRIARSTAHLLECLNLFQHHKKDFISISESIDTSTNVGKMVFTFLGAIAEFERGLIKERVITGIRRAQSNNIHCGRPRKGFDIAAAVTLQKQGLGYKQISKRLNVPRATIFRYLSALNADKDGKKETV